MNSLVYRFGQIMIRQSRSDPRNDQTVKTDFVPKNVITQISVINLINDDMWSIPIEATTPFKVV